MTKAEKELRQAIIDKCLWMNASGLNQGTSGNISARYKNQMLITPSGIPYEQLKPELIASMPARALPDVRDGLKPVHRRVLMECTN